MSSENKQDLKPNSSEINLKVKDQVRYIYNINL
jgi:hypothetical protein